MINQLDATEELKSSDLKTKVECDHIEAGLIVADDIARIMEFVYCPVCGEKL